MYLLSKYIITTTKKKQQQQLKQKQKLKKEIVTKRKTANTNAKFEGTFIVAVDVAAVG